MDALVELVDFLTSTQPEVRKLAVENIAAQSQNAEALEVLSECPDLFPRLIKLTADVGPIAKEAFAALINLCQKRELALTMIKHTTLIERMVEVIRDKESGFIELAGMLLSNLTRYMDGCNKLLQVGERLQGLWVCQLLDRFVKDIESESVAWISLSIMNVTQLEPAQQLLLDQERAIMKSWIPFMHHPQVIRRRGVLGTLKNCCFVSSAHEYLLCEELGLISHLLTPLVSQPGDFNEEELKLIPNNVKAVMLPTKAREQDSFCRQTVVEVLFMLSSKREYRDMMRDNGVYPVVKALDNVESDEDVKDVILRLVHHLLPDEDLDGE